MCEKCYFYVLSLKISPIICSKLNNQTLFDLKINKDCTYLLFARFLMDALRIIWNQDFFSVCFMFESTFFQSLWDVFLG